MTWETYVCPECGKEVTTTWSNNGCACRYPKKTKMILKVVNKTEDQK